MFGTMSADFDVKFDSFKEGTVQSCTFSNEQIERGFGRFELVSFVFQLDDFCQDRFHQLAVVLEVMLLRHSLDV